MYNNYYPQTYPQTNTPSTIRAMGLKGHPVSSFEEVKATGVDFDGSIFFFPDLANRRIYTKQINLDGTATLNMYELKEMPKETQMNASAFITREEFETALKEIRNVIMKPQPETTAF